MRIKENLDAIHDDHLEKFLSNLGLLEKVKNDELKLSSVEML